VSYGEEKRLTLAGKLKLGGLLTSGADSPIVARFFSGGGSAMRGFNTRRLSPLLAVADEGAEAPAGEPLPGQALPVGGDGLFEASAELRYRLFEDLSVAGFVDSGFVTPGPLELLRPAYYANNLLVAVGLGVRYATPFGPIRLDLARRLNVGPPLPVEQPVVGPPVAYPLSSNCFGLGGASPGYAGSPEGLCTIHLSIGEAF
jgi:translocation and assembly module TamA